MSEEIFVSYRRQDSAPWTGRLFDRLRNDFGRSSIFMDVYGIPGGENFIAAIDQQVKKSEVVLAIIGPEWLASVADGTARARGPSEFVGYELLAALSHHKPIIPVLVGGGRMPSEADLPANLAPIARLNAISISHERFEEDASILSKAIRQAVEHVTRQTALNAGFLHYFLNALGPFWSLLLGFVCGLPIGILVLGGTISAFEGRDFDDIATGAGIAISGLIAFTAAVYLFKMKFAEYLRNKTLFNFNFGLISGAVTLATVTIGLPVMALAYFYFWYRVQKA